MGSVTSFFILCIVNGAICRWSQELDQDKCILLRDCQLAINGDDAILRITEFGRSCWVKIAKVAGMSPSIGKVYFSSSFLNMNSTTFRRVNELELTCDLRISKRLGRAYIPFFTQVPYVNMGLLSGFTRSSTQTIVSTKNDPSLGAKLRELVGTAPSSLSEKLISKFISYNEKQLKSFSIPWFIPEHLGGYGFPSAGRFGPDDKYLRLAKKIFLNPEKFPLPSLPRDLPWRTWILVKKRFPLPEASSLLVQSLESSPNMSYNDFWAKAAVALLFDKGLTLKHLLVGDKPNREKSERALSMKAYRDLSRVWASALRDVENPFYRFTPFDPKHFPKYHSLHDVPLLHSEVRQPWLDHVTWAYA